MIAFPNGFDLPFLDSLAKTIGDSWVVNKGLSNGKPTVYLTNKNNRDHLISLHPSNGKYAIATQINYCVFGGMSEHSKMHASVSRNAYQIGREVKRRLFIGYDEAIAARKAEVLKWKTEQVRGQLVIDALSRLVSVYQSARSEMKLCLRRWHHNKPDIEVTRYYSDGDRFDLNIGNVDGELLVKITALIKTHEKEN